MKILLFTGYYLPGFKGGGPIKTISNLISTTTDLISYKIVTSDRDLGDDRAYSTVTIGQWNSLEKSTVFYANKGLKGLKQIANAVLENEYDVIYLNSFFSIRFSIFPLLVAKIYRKRIILGPRGEFSQGALSLKSGKKSLFITLYKMLRLHQGVVFQASSDYEAKDIINTLGPTVDIQTAEDIGAQDFAQTLPVKCSDTLKVIFVSRISPMKNLLMALKVLQNVQQSMSYHIYGPIEDIEYWKECEKMISSLPKNIKVEYKGVLKPNEVVKVMSVYDLFFMPTKGENYSHVIAEALCAGLPLLIADTTPWRDLQEKGIGWDLPLNEPEAFSAAIDQLAVMPIEEHHEMRGKVLVWAKDKFSLRDAIDANIAMFKYAVNK